MNKTYKKGEPLSYALRLTSHSSFRLSAILFLAVMLSLAGCKIYSFTGTNIDYTQVKTVYVETFPNQASTVVPSLSQTLTEKLRNKLISETRLDLQDSEADINFGGVIVSYTVEPAASGADDQAALNRLTITVNANFDNTISGENQNFKSRHFENFDRNANLTDVEETLIDEITTKIVDDIFNKAFANW